VELLLVPRTDPLWLGFSQSSGRYQSKNHQSSKSIKLKDEILSPVEEAQWEMLGKAFYASNKRKFNSEEEAIEDEIGCSPEQTREN
jgi:hypothetical protein